MGKLVLRLGMYRFATHQTSQKKKPIRGGWRRGLSYTGCYRNSNVTYLGSCGYPRPISLQNLRQKLSHFLGLDYHGVFNFVCNLVLRQGLRVKQQTLLFPLFRSLFFLSFQSQVKLSGGLGGSEFGLESLPGGDVSKYLTVVGTPADACLARMTSPFFTNSALALFAVPVLSQGFQHTRVSADIRLDLTTYMTPTPFSEYTSWLNTLFGRLRVTYCVRYRALDRKLRKIVKNRYRYTRQYVAVSPADRLRVGLRYLRVVSPLMAGRYWWARLFGVIHTLLLPQEQSPILTMLKRHQQTALRVLGLR